MCVAVWWQVIKEREEGTVVTVLVVCGRLLLL